MEQWRLQTKSDWNNCIMIKAAPHNSARKLSERFCASSKFQKRGNTVCISRFWNCRNGAKDPLRSADAIVRCCLKAIPHNGTSAFGERFCFKRKCGKCGNTGCVSNFSHCTIGTKDPAKAEVSIMRCCLKQKGHLPAIRCKQMS